MRSRRRTAERLQETAQLRRVIGAILTPVGMIAWVVTAVAVAPPEQWCGIVSGGVLAAVGIMLIISSL